MVVEPLVYIMHMLLIDVGIYSMFPGFTETFTLELWLTLFNHVIHCYKTFFLYVVGENSPIVFKRNFFTMYTVGENSPMTFT